MPKVITDEEVKRHLAVNLTRILDERKLTRTELARRTGDPLMTISTACAGKCVPGAGIVARIAEALDVDVDRLIGPPPRFAPSKQLVKTA